MGNTGLEFECCSFPGDLVIKIHVKVSITIRIIIVLVIKILIKVRITINAIIVLVIKIIFMSFQGRATPWHFGHTWIRY